VPVGAPAEQSASVSAAALIHGANAGDGVLTTPQTMLPPAAASMPPSAATDEARAAVQDRLFVLATMRAVLEQLATPGGPVWEPRFRDTVFLLAKQEAAPAILARDAAVLSSWMWSRLPALVEQELFKVPAAQTPSNSSAVLSAQRPQALHQQFAAADESCRTHGSVHAARQQSRSGECAVASAETNNKPLAAAASTPGDSVTASSLLATPASGCVSLGNPAAPKSAPAQAAPLCASAPEQCWRTNDGVAVPVTAPSTNLVDTFRHRERVRICGGQAADAGAVDRVGKLEPDTPYTYIMTSNWQSPGGSDGTIQDFYDHSAATAQEVADLRAKFKDHPSMLPACVGMHGVGRYLTVVESEGEDWSDDVKKQMLCSFLQTEQNVLITKIFRAMNLVDGLNCTRAGILCSLLPCPVSPPTC
jgi:hypothetical protein